MSRPQLPTAAARDWHKQFGRQSTLVQVTSGGRVFGAKYAKLSSSNTLFLHAAKSGAVDRAVCQNVHVHVKQRWAVGERLQPFHSSHCSFVVECYTIDEQCLVSWAWSWRTVPLSNTDVFLSRLSRDIPHPFGVPALSVPHRNDVSIHRII